MRIGINPEKKNTELVVDSYHRVIIPVYIPHFNDYFKDTLEVFKLCIQSVLKTVNNQTRVTIYNNNSHEDVKKYIDNLYEKESLVDQVFHSKENVGKINAILAAVKGNLEPLITIADADVLFKQDWQANVEAVFNDFKYAGMVSPVPSSKAYSSFTNANWFYGLFMGKLKFENVQQPEAMEMFEKSLELDYTMYSGIHLSKYLTLQNKKGKAVMGCGHFVATLKREVFDEGSSTPAFQKIVGGVENKFIDQPNQDLGYLRLATMKNYAYHMGNVIEDWMYEEYNKLEESTSAPIYQDTGDHRMNGFQMFIGKVIGKMMKKKRLKNKIFKVFLGMKSNY